MAQSPIQNEVQSVVLTGTPTGGTFTLTYAGQTTGNIAFDATAGTVDTALEALSNIGAGEVTCTGGPLPGTPVVVPFSGTLASTNLALMTGDGALLTGGTTPAVSITETTKGYGAEKLAINAGIDALGAIMDTQLAAAGASDTEIHVIHDMLYALGSACADILRDQVS